MNKVKQKRSLLEQFLDQVKEKPKEEINLTNLEKDSVNKLNNEKSLLETMLRKVKKNDQIKENKVEPENKKDNIANQIRRDNIAKESKRQDEFASQLQKYDQTLKDKREEFYKAAKKNRPMYVRDIEKRSKLNRQMSKIKRKLELKEKQIEEEKKKKLRRLSRLKRREELKKKSDSKLKEINLDKKIKEEVFTKDDEEEEEVFTKKDEEEGDKSKEEKEEDEKDSPNVDESSDDQIKKINMNEYIKQFETEDRKSKPKKENVRKKSKKKIKSINDNPYPVDKRSGRMMKNVVSKDKLNKMMEIYNQQNVAQHNLDNFINIKVNNKSNRGIPVSIKKEIASNLYYLYTLLKEQLIKPINPKLLKLKVEYFGQKIIDKIQNYGNDIDIPTDLLAAFTENVFGIKDSITEIDIKKIEDIINKMVVYFGDLKSYNIFSKNIYGF